MPRVSLKRSLRLAMFGLVMLPLLIGGGLSLALAYLTERDSQYLLYTRRATRVSSEVGAYLESLNANLASLNRYREVMGIGPAERNDMFATLMAQQPELIEVALLDAQRRTLAHQSARTPVLGPDALAWLRALDLDAAARSTRPLMGVIEFDALSGEPLFALVRPLVGLRSGALEGYLVARCRMAQVWQIVERLARGTPDESMIVDADGRVIAHPNPSVVLSGSRFAAPAQTSVTRGVDGGWSLAGVAELRVLGREMRVVNAVPLTTAFAGSFRLLLLFLAIAAVTLITAFLLVLYLGRLVLRPVTRLTEAAQRIQGGDWATRVPVPREDELGQLAVTFNAMTAQLRETTQSLELRVAERTAELVRARDEAELANRAKSDFLSSMSHELRTPMNAILGFGQLLESDRAQALPDPQRGYVREILRAGAHLMQLINEVLDMARVESGQLQISMQPVNLGALLDECLSLMQPVAREVGIQLPGAAPAACACFVAADRTRLKQVLLNLLSNAIKYNRAGGSVQLACGTEGDAVRIRVIDTGQGLSSDQQARLFKAFDRLGADRAAIEGTGIGLTLSKRLMEMMRGEIGVDSEVGQGSTFWVRLARAEPPPAVVEVAEAPARLTTATMPLGGTRTVLYIEDNEVNLILMQAVLEQQPGLRLITAPMPGLGLDLARTERPDLILLDIQLPGIDGYEVLRRLRAAPETHDIPVIAISANAMHGDIEQGLAAGFDDYLTKPLDVPHVLRVVKRALATDAA